ncbi:MAG: prepilin-type N-terminal cleavage/methylation domain-containing protein [Ottowia sp.]|nr:prepilin-type N-terminal cleavage/methylation domain-containing protein [Ottowia sp.]
MPATQQYPSNNVGGEKILCENVVECRQLKPAISAYHEKQRGFSLLEVMVAFSIMARSLGLLYRITGSSALQVGSVQQHEQAMALAATVLDTVPAVPEQGIERSEEAAGYAWAIATRPWSTQYDALGRVPRLHEVQVTVSWQDGERTREFTLTTLRPERLPEPGARR